mmetsp:Transcript_8546/g.12754  ORF Transcript_8546/g.12754 Transcript_8546/m.12754 type:complete len:146 (+) Transcript_8546:68-505(+)
MQPTRHMRRCKISPPMSIEPSCERSAAFTKSKELFNNEISKTVSFSDDTTTLVFDGDEPSNAIPLYSDVTPFDEDYGDSTNICEEHLVKVIRTRLPTEIQSYFRLDLTLQIPGRYKKTLEDEFNVSIEDLGRRCEDIYVYEFWKR